VSPFRPSFPPQPCVCFRNWLLLPSSVPRHANISPILSTLRILPVATGVWAAPVFLATRHSSLATSHCPFVFILLRPLSPLFALFCALPSFVFNRLQPLFPKHPGGGSPKSSRTRREEHSFLSIEGWGYRALHLPRQTTRGHASACPLHNSSQLRVSYAPAPFEKLPTASASVLYTSKTVRSLVICRTS
jgi:hypothetical protein